MRERHCIRPVGTCIFRITPARAGKTPPMSFSSLFCRDHPRSCGKDALIIALASILIGSPPLVRERPFIPPCTSFNRRITPARAGKTTSAENARMAGRDHPRSCGKDIVTMLMNCFCLGSPPLVRERRCFRPCSLQSSGITPARAGKTFSGLLHRRDVGDHPRSCGKDRHMPEFRFQAVGSPPLVRERPSDGAGEVIPFGITPARAGKTWCLSRMAQRCEDHPRSCGKDVDSARDIWRNLGSPPLVRERLILDCDNQHNVGITPARAGKTPA